MGGENTYGREKVNTYGREKIHIGRIKKKPSMCTFVFSFEFWPVTAPPWGPWGVYGRIGTPYLNTHL